MAVELYAFTCGFLTLPRAFLLKGESGMITVPVPSYLIVHPKGRVLFDTGLHEKELENPADYAGDVIARYHTFHFSAGEEIGARLRAIGVDPDGINIVVNSHLHFDHCGGNAQLPNADILIQRRELEHARATGSTNGYLVTDWDTGQGFREVDGEHDIFGDGTVVCLPTYGHTPGHQSLVVETAGGRMVLCGDACYFRRTLEEMRLPSPIGVNDAEGMRASLRKLKALQDAGARLMYGHDPEFWQDVPQAPRAVA